MRRNNILSRITRNYSNKLAHTDNLNTHTHTHTQSDAHVIRVSSELDHPSEDEESDSITDETKGGTTGRLLPPHLRSKPLVGGCRERERPLHARMR